ncbi:FecR family protein [Sandaracinobacter neustonicus]|nr:FecR domain-containing protein [Sandaracinobacter neustonicus]
MNGRETSAEIDEVAARWAVRIDNAPLRSDEQAELDVWLSGDVRRLGAFARARAVFAHASRSRALGPGFNPDEFLAGLETLPIANPHDPEAPDDVDRRQSRRAVLIGGSGVLAAGISVALGLRWQTAANSVSTQRGEIRLVPLPDGSTMTLNTASAAHVEFSDRLRQVTLKEGEALFDVARDVVRPFVVMAGSTSVRAVGTSFTVSRIEARPVQVLVRQGTVEVETGGQLRSVSQIGANRRAVVRQSHPVEISSVNSADVDRELAWREGMLSFEDCPLREAAAQFARYSDSHILFADPAIGNETITGLYAANNPRGFAQSAALSLGLEIGAEGDSVVLRRAG